MSYEWSGLVFAFTAGLFTFLSPCSYPMLPGYISYYIGSAPVFKKALLSGVVCSLGLIIVFSLVGLIVFIVGAFINPYLKMLQIVAAVIIIGFGVILLMRVTMPRLSMSIPPPMRRGYLGLFLYGIAYGMAALACSSPIFLSVILYASLSGGSMQALVTFLVYSLGMGTPLIVITYLVATMKQLLINRIRSTLPVIQRILFMRNCFIVATK